MVAENLKVGFGLLDYLLQKIVGVRNETGPFNRFAEIGHGYAIAMKSEITTAVKVAVTDEDLLPHTRFTESESSAKSALVKAKTETPETIGEESVISIDNLSVGWSFSEPMLRLFHCYCIATARAHGYANHRQRQQRKCHEDVQQSKD
ncbi:hypothetical protein KIN20_020416 [Parelaphostrongylus tenuis]|uniref:Uncharacterized protein n=1 Tax=Parelaphostrongylus tenuis TaxID=148309 RepID=A0AAD5MMK8_PARTN|nr:hypothetical protein KIN20_020416 [Parelaphostrongylus tenuis]